MNNLRKPLKEFFQVNHEAGLLRLFLAVILTFILWSLLAAISALFKPLGSLNFGNILDINSQNLALSLLLDIINAYFSTFSISLLILFLLIAYTSFDSISNFYKSLKSFSSKRVSKNHLSSCAFSFPKRKMFLFTKEYIKYPGNIPDGPFEAAIESGYAILVSNGVNYSVEFNKDGNSDNFVVSIPFRKKIVDCFSLNPASISFKTEEQISTKSFLIEVAYSYNLPSDNENLAKFASMLALCDSGKIRKIIENILISETNVSLSQYLRNSLGSSAPTLEQVSEKPIHKNENKTEEIDQKKHTIFNFYKIIQDQGIKRNRKRLVYLPPSPKVASISINNEENLSTSLKDQLNELLSKNLQSTLLTLFGTVSLNAEIINIQEQGSK